MFLKRLEIAGFKSFPEKIKLDFPEGVTAVVGPNGSGKSNIADAVRWVMGEQSAKSLRGAKMEDVIFSGTEHRRPLGYAEVQMLIDNTSGLLPVEYSEVNVTRRVYRSNESEYLINGSPCRMKDTLRLFMDTGVGREGYSIIGQGKVDEILSTRSEDRRHLFEEAAGIVKYKSRRHETLLKLDREKQNLLRVDDLIQELAAQMEPMAHQAEQAKIYLNLRDEYKTIHINLFLKEAARAEEDEKKAQELYSNLSAQSEGEEKLLAQSQAKLSDLKEEESKAESAYKEANRQIIQKVTTLEKAESNMRLADRIAKEMEAKQADLNRESASLSALTESQSNEEQIKQEISALSAAQAKLTETGTTLQVQIQSTQQKLHSAQSRQKLLTEMERGYEGYYNSVKAIFSQNLNGILGTVGELLTVPEAYETAISVALGSASQNILTATEADAQRAIAYLKSARAGRATFLPLTAMRPRGITSEMDKLLQEPGIIGLASLLVSFDLSHSPVFDYLLGNVFVAEKLNKASEISKKYRQSYRLVTLDGDLITPGGAMTGGSLGRQTTSFLSRSRQISELDQQIKSLQAKAKELESAREAHEYEVQKSNQKMARLTERKIHTDLLLEGLQKVQNNVNRLTDEFESIKSEKAALSGAGDPKVIRMELDRQKESLAAAETQINRLRSEIAQLEEAIKAHMEAIARLSREAARLEARHEQIESESRRLHNEVWDAYGLTFQGAQELYKPEYSTTFLRSEEKRLKTELSAFENVNIGAIEAYTNLRTRHDFLYSQRNDILKAEESLHEIISQLTEQMEQQFSVQFSRIARHFDEVFKEMFGGGKAGLAMSDPDHILESGIEITAQPPGKNLQSLSLLSGGERALTAIALLFGILKMKPAPFCILDEIESALDDANVKRFAQYLKLHSDNTQFIVITHRKGTMECADTLYGVTMQELGVSKMVSVDFR